MYHLQGRPDSPPAIPSIKTAVAANLGSSLFLFQGLETVSPHIFNEASLQPPSRSASPASSRQSFETMGSASKARRSWFGSVRFLMVPQNLHQRLTPKQSSKPATPQCESFLLTLSCSTCARRNARTGRHETCSTQSEFNFSGGRYAFLGPADAKKAKFKYARDMEERVLELDLCDFANYARVRRTEEVLKTHMGDPYMAAEQGSELRPVNVAELLEGLRRAGVEVQEPVKKATREW
ncbi:hypothetical protein QBC47DRAFT_308958 [Echria macrotheca]|uniref:Uncharacterized protein n=1 Tax=Echria macrotheca TaxID=438768 RepID=A0AAJ0B7R0_9PEZI|nr:hypothetical protein QBC47DRAFT_308958 [Echria macrotheca]